jgi:outer membrane protein assembly factor BamB
LLSTRGGVLFGGDYGAFFALDERSGKLLWSVETGGTMFAAPVTYSIAGEQLVSVIAGRNLMTFALPKPSR